MRQEAPHKLLETMLYWGPLVVGGLSLIVGVIALRGHGPGPGHAGQMMADPALVEETQQAQVPKTETKKTLSQQTLAKKTEPPQKDKAKKTATDQASVQARAALLGENALQKVLLEKEQAALKGRIDPAQLTGLSKEAHAWGLDTGRLGVVLMTATAHGVKKSGSLALKQLVYKEAVPLGTAAQAGRLGLARAGGFGAHHFLATTGRSLGHQAELIEPLRGLARSHGLKGGRAFTYQTLGQTLTFKQTAPLFAPHAAHKGAERFALEHYAQAFSTKLGGKALGFTRLGIEGAVGAAGRLKSLAAVGAKTPALTPLTIQLPPLDESSAAEGDCAARYYSALQQLRAHHIEPLRANLKPLFQKNAALPGKWMFRPQRSKGKRVCKRYKYYWTYSGKKKRGRCAKWGRRLNSGSQGALSKEEQQFFKLARQFVVSYGRGPAMKPRSPNHWVINRVTLDLKTYSTQAHHPAICTGAIRMVDYFEGNLGRVKKLVSSVHDMAARNDALLEARRHLAADVLKFSSQSATLKQSLSPDPSDRPLHEANHSFALPALSSRHLTEGLEAITERIMGQTAAAAVRAAPDFFAKLRTARTHLAKTGPVVPVNAHGLRDIQRLFGLIEASFYIQQAEVKLTGLRQQLFGTLSGLRLAHQTYCQCDD